MLSRCASQDGWLAAASGFEHYRAVWMRDAAITALCLGEQQDGSPWRAATRATVHAAMAQQAPLGQIPVAHFVSDAVWDWGEMGNHDGTALFILLAALHLRMQPDDPARDGVVAAMRRAASWLAHQDANNMGVLDSQQASDWMDSTLNRSGKVLHVNVLWYAALRAMAREDAAHAQEHADAAESVRHKGNLLFWPEDPERFHELLAHVRYPRGSPRFSHATSLRAYAAAVRGDRSQYVSHVEYGRFVDRCDVLANALAVLTGFAPEERARRIARRLGWGAAVQPYPARAWDAPITEHDDSQGLRKIDAERFQDVRWRTPPHRYHNAAVWPFIGGVVIAALCAAGEQAQAVALLPSLAAANRLSANGDDAWGFHEWIAADTGAPDGASSQAWSAAGFVLAQRAVSGEPVRW